MPLIKLSSQNFEIEVIKSEQTVLVDYWSPTCGPCDMYNQVLETMQSEYEDTIKFCKLNVDEEILIANQEQIIVMPTTKIYQQGEATHELFGVQTPKELHPLFKSLSLV